MWLITVSVSGRPSGTDVSQTNYTYKDSDNVPEVADDNKHHSSTTKPHRYRWDHATLELHRLLTGANINAV